ncbi:MAG: DUF4359 domain-containing protein [Rhizobiaceae bacterium]
MGAAAVELFDGPLLSSGTFRKNYFLFSIYTTNIDNKNKIEAVGLFQRFIFISP